MIIRSYVFRTCDLCDIYSSMHDFFFSEGKMHDAAMLAESGFLRDLNMYAFSQWAYPSAYMVI